MRKNVAGDPLIIKLLIFMVLFTTLFFGPQPFAFANVLQDAHQKQVQAQEDYYRGLRNLGLNANPGQRQQLFQDTMFQAQSGWVGAVNKYAAQRQKEIRQLVFDSLKKFFPAAFLPKSILDPYSAKGIKGTKANRSNSGKLAPAHGGSSAYSPDTSPINTGPVLDGSNIPKEIEFPGKKKIQNKPAPLLPKNPGSH
jgi:hypothetical protein